MLSVRSSSGGRSHGGDTAEGALGLSLQRRERLLDVQLVLHQVVQRRGEILVEASDLLLASPDVSNAREASSAHTYKPCDYRYHGLRCGMNATDIFITTATQHANTDGCVRGE